MRNSTIQIRLPYVFHVTGKIGRKMDRVIAGEFKQFDLPIADASAAPVCMAFETLEPYNFFEDHAVGKTAVVRYFDGAFYRAKKHDGRPVHVDSLPSQLLVDYAEFGGGATEQVRMQATGRPIPRPDFQGETFTDEDDIREALELAVASLLVVDGEVWEKCPEPVLIVEEDVGRHCSYVSPGFLDTYQPDKRSNHYVFDIDQMAEAVRFAERRSAHVGEEIEVRVAADVSVIAPELLERGQSFSDIIRHAGEFLYEAGKVSLNEVPSEFSRVWYSFQDTLLLARHEMTEDRIDAVFDTWSDMIRVYADQFPDRTTGVSRQVLDSWREYFDERPVTETSVIPVPGRR